jgi:hypothetical protein
VAPGRQRYRLSKDQRRADRHDLLPVALALVVFLLVAGGLIVLAARGTWWPLALGAALWLTVLGLFLRLFHLSRRD